MLSLSVSLNYNQLCSDVTWASWRFSFLGMRWIVQLLQWRHNGRDGVSNHQPPDCLLNRYSGADQRKHQSTASLAFVRGIHRWPVNSPHKWPVKRKMFSFDDVIMQLAKVNSKESIKAPHFAGPFWEESLGDRWIPLTQTRLTMTPWNGTYTMSRVLSVVKGIQISISKDSPSHLSQCYQHQYGISTVKISV